MRAAAARKRAVEDRDLLRIGRQFLRFVLREDEPFFVHYDAQGAEVGRHALAPGRPIVLGRQAPDITLDPDDSTLSRRHLAISVEDGRVTIKDLKSLNGAYLRVRTAVPLEHGDEFRAGQQRFVFSVRGGPVLDPGHDAPPAGPSPVVEGAEPAPDTAGASITVKGTGESVPIAPGQSVCEALEQHGVEINAECHSGVCGSDPIRLVSGHENVVSPPADQERETLEDLCELEAGKCRLACLLKVKGPIEIEIVGD